MVVVVVVVLGNVNPGVVVILVVDASGETQRGKHSPGIFPGDRSAMGASDEWVGWTGRPKDARAGSVCVTSGKKGGTLSTGIGPRVGKDVHARADLASTWSAWDRVVGSLGLAQGALNSTPSLASLT